VSARPPAFGRTRRRDVVPVRNGHLVSASLRGSVGRPSARQVPMRREGHGVYAAFAQLGGAVAAISNPQAQ